MELEDRKLRILQAIIQDFISTAEPVGSRTSLKYNLGISSATIRNEMSDLEELGYCINRILLQVEFLLIRLTDYM